MDEKKAGAISLENVVYKTTVVESQETEQRKTSNFLYLSACAANIIAFVIGTAIGWTSPVIPKLNGSVDPENNPLSRPITPTEESWIAAFLHLGGALGPLVAGTAADKIGRKRFLLLISLPIGVSFLITAYASSVYLFYFARLILGFGAGSIFAVLPNYLAEIAQDHNRGTLGCIMGVFISLGILFDYSVGPLLTVKGFSIACFLPLCLFVAVFGKIIPESPHYLASKGKNNYMESSLRILRPLRYNTNKEISVLLKNLQATKNKVKFSESLKSKCVRKGLIISLGMIALQQFSGINAIFSYMQSIFKSSGSTIPPDTSTLIIAVIQTIVTCVTTLLVDRLGRKILLLISALVSGLSLIPLGAYFYIKDSGSNVDSISWIPISSLITFIIAFNIGLGPLPWAVIGEIFSSEVKASASTIICCICFLASFTITLFFPGVSAVIGIGQSFWIFAICCLVGAGFIFVVMPETKGKTLEEIQEILER